MSRAEAIQRAWVVLSVGVVLLGLVFAQIWAGKAFVGFDWRASSWALRKKEPFLFWGNIVPIGAAGVFAVGFALTILLRNSN